jgi:hypothetical protein
MVAAPLAAADYLPQHRPEGLIHEARERPFALADANPARADLDL